jgi:Glycosyl transferase family 2
MLVMTLRTRDHADVVDAQVAFHLNAGVDFVLANDHRSRDGTREILQEYERAGVLHLTCREDESYTPGIWVNELAQRACAEHGADWILHADADEFWWPHGGDLKEVLGAVPERYGALLCPWRHFAPRPENGSHFAERMLLRRGSHAPHTGPEDQFHANVNVVHRADPSVLIRPGNHGLDAPFPTLRGWHPIEVLHFPIRSRAQAEAKFAAWGALGDGISRHVDAAAAALRGGDFEAYLRRYLVDDATCERGLADGTLALDTRLRDALRTLAGDVSRPLPERPRFRLGAPLEFPHPDQSSLAELADDTSVLHDPGAAAERRVDRFEARLAAFERRAPARLARRLRSRGIRRA